MNMQLSRIKKIVENYTKGYSLKVLHEPIREVTDFSIYESDVLLESDGGSGWRYQWETPVNYITTWFRRYIHREDFDKLVRALSKTEKIAGTVFNHVSRCFRINIMIEKE